MKRLILALIFSMFAFNSFGQTPSNQLVLDFKDAVTQQQILEFERQYDISTHLNSAYSDDAEIRLTDSLSQEQIDNLLVAMRGDPRLEFAEENAVYSIPSNENNIESTIDFTKSAASYPNDPKFKFQWHMNNIRMPEAWAMKGGTGKGTIVAVIDTGVAYENYTRGNQKFVKAEDLAQTCFVQGYDFIHDDSHGLDDHAHGTHCAGTIAQSTNNNLGVTGVAPEACIMPLKVLSSGGSGTVADIADAIRFAADNKAQIISMSLGGPSPSSVMGSAVAYAISKGVLVVAAAGNDGSKRVGYPAAYEGVIAVSATDASNGISWYSTTGKDIDIAAPGGDTRDDKNGDGVPDGVVQNTIKTNDPTQQGYYPFQGTSMATPHVAGALADILASGVKDPKKATEILYASANRKVAEEHGAPKGQKWDDRYGHGLIDVAAALKMAKDLEINSNVIDNPGIFTTIAPTIDDAGVFFTKLGLELTWLILLSVMLPFMMLGVLYGTKARKNVSYGCIGFGLFLGLLSYSGFTLTVLGFTLGTIWFAIQAVSSAAIGFVGLKD